MATRSQTGAQAIERAVAVLDCFISVEQELGVSEIARGLDLTTSTVHRIVRALTRAGYLEQNVANDRYHLGRMAVLLGQVAQRTTGLDRVQPLLEQLSARVGDESVNFVIPDDADAVIALHVEAKHPLRFDQPVGTRVALHASASGKALLAFSPDREERVRQLGRVRGYTTYTITSRQKLLAELKETHARGYSLDEQETQLGVRCVGVPVLNAQGYAVAALGIQIPMVRIEREQLPELAPIVNDIAARITSIIADGYSPARLKALQSV